MKEIKINVLGRIKDSIDKIIVEQEDDSFLIYYISNDEKKLVGKYATVDEVVENFDYEVIWLDNICSICNKMRNDVPDGCCNCDDCLTIDNPNLTPNAILTCENYQETCEEIQNTFPEATEFFGVDNEDYKDFIERQ